jgi:hypothetical protein
MNQTKVRFCYQLKCAKFKKNYKTHCCLFCRCCCFPVLSVGILTMYLRIINKMFIINSLKEDQIADSYDHHHLEVINHKLKGVKVECLSTWDQFHQPTCANVQERRFGCKICCPRSCLINRISPSCISTLKNHKLCCMPI